mmetsp:Transcript_22930/g.48435  ORF Transcript_22930/g.48435 Transcript_22930/m.48435 type:complete len:207 (-) Transcript_22930:676-1296(-)
MLLGFDRDDTLCLISIISSPSFSGKDRLPSVKTKMFDFRCLTAALRAVGDMFSPELLVPDPCFEVFSEDLSSKSIRDFILAFDCCFLESTPLFDLGDKSLDFAFANCSFFKSLSFSFLLSPFSTSLTSTTASSRPASKPSRSYPSIRSSSTIALLLRVYLEFLSMNKIDATSIATATDPPIMMIIIVLESDVDSSSDETAPLIGRG